MDVSQVRNDIDKSFNWGPTFKDDANDDFARHLADADQADRPEPTERVESREDVESVRDRDDDRRDDPDTSEYENDNPADKPKVAASPAETTAVAPQAAPTAAAPTATSSQPLAASETVGSGSPATASMAAGTDPKAATAASAGAQIPSATAEGSMVTPQTGAETAATQSNGQAANPAGEAIAAAAQKQGTDPKVANTAAATNPSATVAAANSKGKNSPATEGPVSAEKTGPALNTAAGQSQDATAKAANQGQMVNPLEKMRQDEMAKMTEKEVLSAKVSEMLANGKGKITVTTGSTSGSASGAASSMVSGGNTLQANSAAQQSAATAATPKADTAIATVTQSAQQAEMPIIIPNGDLAMSLLPAQGQSDTNAMTGSTVAPGAAVGGIDATSSSSASQATQASRASTQAGSPAEQVSAQITKAAKDGMDQIKVQLNPAELGRVDVKMELGHDGRIMAVISADNPDSLETLRQDANQLAKALQDAGFETGSDSLNFTLNQGNDEGSAEQQLAGGNAAGVDGIEEEPVLDTAAYANSTGSDSGLDIQV